MGILDDAIRQHLELKRQHGAESDDLERLENEAFGPATRPGDPEYATGESAVAPIPETDETTEPEPEAAAPAGGFFDYQGDGGESSEWSVPDEDPTRIVPPEPSPAEAARADHPELGETADHPAPAPLEEEPPTAVGEEPPSAVEEVAPPAPSEPPEAPEHAIFESGEIDFGDLDLDLEDEPPPEVEAPAPSLSKPLEPVPEVPLADSPFEEDQDDFTLETGENESSLADPAAPPPVVDEDQDGEEAEDDLLEETPDFLQDAPEGERLWFEQGAPKDFDFDDD